MTGRPRTASTFAWGVFLAVLVGATVALALPWREASARSRLTDFTATLGKGERDAFEKWYFAQIAHAAAVESYWRAVDRKRRLRKRLRKSGWNFKPHHYVTRFPPRYEGPSLGKALRRKWAEFQAARRTPVVRERPAVPGLAEFMASARRHYGFAPERIDEAEFKRRYAREALAAGLTKDQIVRIYALETGGYGTADMQAGIHPITRRGKPISTAIGYAQLLAANTINMVAKYGRRFEYRLKRMARSTRDPERRAKLYGKIKSLRAMMRTARSVPRRWSSYVALARTSRGRGLHPLNIDGDVGPWLQVIKLKELRELAAKRGRGKLTGAQIELMNLAGPATGLEMLMKVARDKPTPNFFSRRAYYRNSIVRGQSATGLVGQLEARMKTNINRDGAKEFARIFDELLRKRRASNQ